MPLLNFCKNSAAELYGIDETVAYQVGFEYVRQLAIHLRNSINATSNAKEGYKTIYNWQYCHSLDFWSRVLAQQCNPEKELQTHKSKESPLRQLIYPLVQVTLGAIRLIPTAQFFPLRFYLIRSLIRLSQSTGVFIPIFPLIIEVLNSTAITKNPKKTNLPPFDFENNVKVNQQYLGTKVYQDGLTEQFVELTAEFFVLYSKSVAFPELTTPAVISLRRFIKKSKNSKFNKQLGQLIEKLNENAKFISGKRSNIEYGPSNKQEVALFLNDLKWEKTPLGQYVVVQRKVKEERLRLLKEAIEQDEEAKSKRNDMDEDEEAEAALDEVESDEDEEEESDE
ncbi:Noc2-domain-containing protein [Yamadazyma tenuis ATCC 10573]|uniref:Noc2-domain-containing protein n=2 Tax=Candida tenuis TaxID=2315449 RepID=G3B8K4_CANTC|nr:Noc2-domain-containing protein [Yamadazyma tenuis ATCC 10573]EGV61754.1 Noc2-domain-containing protein [Yamadazyma tenuis ATCC 10573]